MNSKHSFAEMKIVILGTGRQGLALARFFLSRGAQVTASDMASEEKLGSQLDPWSDLPVELVLGGHPTQLLDNCDLLCLSGGVPPQIPLVQTAIERGIPLTNDMLLTLQSARSRGLGPVIAITGSSGKTTTTTLVGKMLAEGGRTVHVGGNIGTPLLDQMDDFNPGDCIVLELSSFQLEILDAGVAYGKVDAIGPDVAALLNVTPNHLDRHPSMAAYTAAKLNLIESLPPGATLVLSADDALTARLIPDKGERAMPPLPQEWDLDVLSGQFCAKLAAGQFDIRSFSLHDDPSVDARLHGDNLTYAGQVICRRDEVELRGEHNLSNILAAATIVGALGTEVSAMGRVARTFKGVAHRLEVVATFNGITWINDSMASSPERTVAALRIFEPGKQTLILLVGGKDKHLPWQVFADEAIERVNMLIGFGEAGPMIVNAVQEQARLNHLAAPNCAVVQRLDEAIDLSARVGGTNSVVLLSPGGTSFDAYPNFEVRGEHFRVLVAQHEQNAVNRHDHTSVH